MTEIEKQSAEQTRREKITERYKGVDPSKLEVIPAVMSESVNIMEQKLKVAAYVRVSTDNDEQKSSFELQSNDFTNRINSNPNWELAGHPMVSPIPHLGGSTKEGAQKIGEELVQIAESFFA